MPRNSAAAQAALSASELARLGREQPDANLLPMLERLVWLNEQIGSEVLARHLEAIERTLGD